MGAVLVRSAFSANIKERRDCSTALFDERGRMIAQAEHIPVHLGAMPDAVAAVRRHEPKPGEVWRSTIPTRAARTSRHHAGLTYRGRLLGHACAPRRRGRPRARLDARRFPHVDRRGRRDPADPARRRGHHGARGADAESGRAPRRPASTARRAPAREAARRRAVRAARARPRRGRDGRALRVLGAQHARRHLRPPRRTLRGPRRARGTRRRR